MPASTLSDAFDDSLARMARGQTINDCVKAHPHFANDLRQMLSEIPEVVEVEPDPKPATNPIRETQTSYIVQTEPKRALLGRLSMLGILLAFFALVVVSAIALLDPIFMTQDVQEAPRQVIAPLDTNTSFSRSSACALPSGWVTYEVVAGDTLSELALFTDSTVAELRDGNCMSPGDPLPIGYNLYLPRNIQD